MICLSSIGKTFNPGTVNASTLFSDFDLHIEKQSFVSVIGSNGSGKTTLLNLISGSLSPDTGSILLDGVPITTLPEYKRAKRIGRVFQNPAVGTVANMTVTENLALAENKGKPFLFKQAVSKDKKEYYRSVVADLGLGLEDKTEVPVGSLSGGQRQALALLMVTMTDIDLLLLDEHTAALDPKTAELIMHLTDSVIRKKKLTALMVTHNLRYAVEYGDRILMLHEGKIILDKAGTEKQELHIEDILGLFNQISIELGN